MLSSNTSITLTPLAVCSILGLGTLSLSRAFSHASWSISNRANPMTASGISSGGYVRTNVLKWRFYIEH